MIYFAIAKRIDEFEKVDNCYIFIEERSDHWILMIS